MKGEPAGAPNGRGNGEEPALRLQELSRALPEVGPLEFSAQRYPSLPRYSPAPRSRRQPVFFLRGFPRRLGWGWEARLRVLREVSAKAQLRSPRPPSRAPTLTDQGVWLLGAGLEFRRRGGAGRTGGTRGRSGLCRGDAGAARRRTPVAARRWREESNPTSRTVRAEALGLALAVWCLHSSREGAQLGNEFPGRSVFTPPPPQASSHQPLHR